MANELRHGSVGTELTQAEWEAVGTHVLNSQAAGDIVYAASSSQLSRLGKGADNTVLHLASGIPAWSATLAGLTLTTPTISSTGFTNATHAHAASNSGGTISAGALSGTTLASGVVTTSATTVGTIATGVWQGTDVGVAYGGTGVSTLTANGVLVGNGASAIGSIDMSTKGHVLIGDGSGNPQMLSVGTNTHVLTADSGETTGVKWAAPAAAAAGSLTGSTLASGVVTTSATTVGVLNAGSITSGFGNIDNGSSTFDTGQLRTGGATAQTAGDLALKGSSPQVVLERAGGSTDWGVINSGGTFRIRSASDAASWTNEFNILAGGKIIVLAAATPSAGGDGMLIFPDIGTAPGTLGSNTAIFYADDVGGTTEAFAIDEAGNAAQLTPHPATFLDAHDDASIPYPWAYHASNDHLGSEIHVDMSGLVAAVEALTGKTFAYIDEYTKTPWANSKDIPAWMASRGAARAS